MEPALRSASFVARTLPHPSSLLRRLFHVALFVLAGAAAHGDSWAQPVTSARVDGARVIVKLRNDSALVRERSLQPAGERGTRAKALGRSSGVPMRDGIVLSDREQVVLADGITSEALARRLSLDDNVEYAVPDERRHILAAPNDPLYASGPEPGGPARAGVASATAATSALHLVVGRCKRRP